MGAASLMPTIDRVKSGIHRNPRPDVPTALTPVPAVTPAAPELSLRTVGDQELAALAVAEMPALSARTVVHPDPPAKLKPLAPEKYELHMTIPQSTHDKLRLALRPSRLHLFDAETEAAI